MKHKLTYLSERQSTLAQNIANADTPDYKAKDVEAPDFQAMLGSAGGEARNLHMSVTNAKHMTGNASKGAFKVIKSGKTDELSPNGNNVVIEEEMSKVASNQAEYVKTLNLYSKAIAMFKSAIGAQNNG